MNIFAKIGIYLVAFASVFAQIETAEAKRRDIRDELGSEQGQRPDVDDSAGDSELVDAVRARRFQNFVEGGSLTVVKLMADDNTGLEHQKWVVRLSNGETMQAVYNLDMCPRVPLKVGDVIAMGGQFIWTNQGGLLHWLHHDPRGNRPDGYVYVNGNYYCKE